MRQRRRLLLLTLCCTLLCGAAHALTGQYIPSDRFSSGLINAMCQDRYGYMWIATENGLNKFDGYRFTTYYHHKGDSTSLGSNIVTSLYQDKQGQLWVGTRTGLFRYNYESDDFTCFPTTEENEPRVTAIFERKNGEFLVGTSGRGLWTLRDGALSKIPEGYSTSGGKWYYNQMLEDSRGRFWKCGYGDEVTMMDGSGVHQFFIDQSIGITVRIVEFGDEILIIGLHGISSCHNGTCSRSDIDLSALGGGDVVMCCAFKDHAGNVYIGTRGDGLFRLPKGSRKVERVECTLQGMDLNTAKIWSIGEDRHGNIWLGCQSKGLVILPSQEPQFAAWSFSAQRYFISSTITSVCQGDNGITWCTVQGSGVFGFDATGRIVAHPAAPAAAEYIYREQPPTDKPRTGRERYWLATDEALYSYDPVSGRYQHQISLTADRVNAIVNDDEGNLYISTFSRGFSIYNPETRALKKLDAADPETPKGRLCNNWVMAMMRDRGGHIWLATSSGVSCYDPVTASFRALGFDRLMDGMICFSLCETRQGIILIGTDQGVYSYTPGQATTTPFPDDSARAGSTDANNTSLDDKTVAYMAESKDGTLWFATSMGIWQYDAKTQKFIDHVNGNGLTAKEYVTGVGMRTDDDVVYFANNDGLTVFRPKEVTGSHKQLSDVSLTGFTIAGNAVSPLADRFTVSYLDNTIALEFSLLDFNNPSNIIYEYRINNEQWIQNDEGKNAIQLSHLQPGTYKIEVRALAAGITSPTKTITVVVTPPWWRTTLAYILYVLGLMGLVGFMGFMYRRRTHQQMDEEKMKFLINATHDIRSPLTLIMGAVNKLKEVKVEGLSSGQLSTLNSQLSTPVEAIDRNANRLLVLVNQILDERRIDKNQMQLHCRETNLVDFISNICKLYQYNATQRNIAFTFEHDKDHVLAWVDRVQFDKVVSNLLSNAFKYTFDGGEVKVVLREGEKGIDIQVVDNGLGFKGDEADKLFDRFYQGSNSASLGMQGTGIGLNLCRAITQMHGGRIKAQNRTDGQQGATFTVTIPAGNTHLRPEQIVTDEPAREVLSVGKSGTSRLSHILIVDDDREIADYIIGELGDHYRFDYAPNGKEGLKMLLTQAPLSSRRGDGGEAYDLVISDVMMPEMDGLQMLRRIKDNPTISQLPVVMLTSKAEVEYKLEGLKSGADAYIPKPFDMEELHIQIDNLIAGVRRLRGKFSGAVSQEERVENIEVKGNDEALMERIMKSVNANMSNPAYTVDTMAEDVGISRAQLHRKMKEMTGIATGKFLRNLRMEQAARLLREGKINVAQIADRVGYADQAHFSTAFKSHFGLSPSEYAETHREE